MLGPIPQLTRSSVTEQLDGGTGSEQPQCARPHVPEEQLPRFVMRSGETEPSVPPHADCNQLIRLALLLPDSAWSISAALLLFATRSRKSCRQFHSQ
jgi:hypothetical protein